jgi:hypothetical protein
MTLASTRMAMAQFGGTARWTWQVSLDSGNSWQSGRVEIPAEGPQNVEVRALLDWSSDAGLYYVTSSFDATVTATTGVGAADFIDAVRPGDLDPTVLILPVASRIGNMLKIDDPRDADPPGLGLFWFRAGNNPMQPDPRRPIANLRFTLHLDGSIGERLVSMVFDPARGRPEGRIGLFQNPSPGVFRTNYPDMTIDGASIVIIPEPWTTVLPILALLARSRRRTNPPQ